MAAALLVLPRTFCAIFFGVLAVLTVIIEYAYYREVPVVRQCYGFFFGRMLRDYGEGKFHLSGGAPVLAAASLSALCFKSTYSPLELAVMMLGDTAAALIGRRFGKHRFFNGKSLEGTLAFVLTGLAVVLIGFAVFAYPWQVLLGGVLGVGAAAVLELFNCELHLDDNLSIPLAVGAGFLLGTLFV